MDQGQSVVFPETTAVDRRLRAPLYHQIYLILRQKICDGAYGFWRDPAERAGGVARLQRLADHRQAGAERAGRRRLGGPPARPRPPRSASGRPRPPVRSSVEGLLENLVIMGLKTECPAARLRLRRGPGRDRPGAGLRGRRDRAAGGPACAAWRAGRLSYLTTHVRRPSAAPTGADDLARTPLLALLERGGVNDRGAEQVITATLADTTVAPLLEVEIGAPLLQVTRIVTDEAQRPVEHLTALYPPERYQHRMVLSRVGSRKRDAMVTGGLTATPKPASGKTAPVSKTGGSPDTAGEGGPR